LIGTMVGAMVPGLGGVITLKDHERIAALRSEMTAYAWLLATVIGTTTLLLNRSFIRLWVGLDERYAGALPNLLIVLLAVQLVFVRNHAYVIDLSLMLVRKITLGIIAVVISTALAWLLIPSLGITGLCLSLLLGRMVLTVWYPLLVRQYFGGLPRASERPWVRQGWLRQGIVMVGLFAPAVYLGERVLADNWLVWVLAAGTTATAALLACLLVGFSSAERARAVRRLQVLTTRGDV
jgi:O-antigen/teichoic acid export membrane protein